MTFDSEERRRLLAERAYVIVTDEARRIDRWEDVTPSADPALARAVAEARVKHADDIQTIQSAELERAQHVIGMWSHNGWGVAPAWARATVERLKHVERKDEIENLDDALTALSQAVN